MRQAWKHSCIQANAVVPEPVPQQVVVQAAGVNLSEIEQEAAVAVLNAGAVGSTAVPVASVTSARVSLATVLRLAERRVVQIFENDFGEWLVLVRVAAHFLLHMSLHWKQPVPLSHAQVTAHCPQEEPCQDRVCSGLCSYGMDMAWP